MIAVLLSLALLCTGCIGSPAVIRTSSEDETMRSSETAAGTAEESTAETSETAPETPSSETKEETETASEPETSETETSEPETSEPETTESETAEPETADSETSGEYTRALAKKNQMFNPEDAKITPYGVRNQKEKTWTVMVYMIGSNLESALGAASQDIEEMADAGLDYDRSNLILYTGGSSRWQSDIPCDRNSVLDLSLRTEDRLVASTEKNADMGAPGTLAAFVNFCTEYYPAEHYALVFWDHGGGPLWGYGSDELFQGDGLLLSELQTAMQNTLFSGNRKLDIVGFDACMMGNLETMTVFADFAELFVASEELEPGDGWDYHFLKSLNETEDGVQISKDIIEAFRAHYEDRLSERYHPDLTLSCTDLTKVRELQRVVSDAAEKLSGQLTKDGFSEIALLRADTRSFGSVTDASGGSSYYYDLVDLQGFFNTISGLSGSDLREAQKALSDAVIENYSNLEDAGGISMYFPAVNRSQYYEMREVYDSLGLNPAYSKFLSKISREWQSATRKDWDDLLPEESEGEYLLQMSEEQQSELISVRYSILRKSGEGAYVPIVSNCRVSWDKDGVVHLPMDPELICLVTDWETTVWPVAETESTKRRRVLKTQQTSLLSGGIRKEDRKIAETQEITVTLVYDVKSGAISIQGVGGSASQIDSSGRENIEFFNYDAVVYDYARLIPAWGSEGQLLPVNEWRKSGDSGAVHRALTDMLDFTTVHASELSEELYYVVTLEDANGLLYVTEPSAISPEKEFEIVKESTVLGVLSFAVYADHAELLSYTGTDERVELPELVSGVPLTLIGERAFSNTVLYNETGFTPVREVVLPEGIESIGAEAFLNCISLETINLPKTLCDIRERAFGNCRALLRVDLPEHLSAIGPYAFYGCDSLTEIELPAETTFVENGAFACCRNLSEIRISPDNPHYCSVDGIMYNRNHEVLIACPAAKTGSLIIDDSAISIAQDAFSLSSLDTVQLPDGLFSVGSYAFFGAGSLQMPVFPESLEKVGKYAFSAVYEGIDPMDLTWDTQEIYIPEKLTEIGTGAFIGYPVRTFSVHPDNPRYSEVSGALSNKAGDALLEFAGTPYRSYVVPDGIRDLDLAVLDELDVFDLGYFYTIELYLPDGLIRIRGESSRKASLVFHCSPGSYAESYAKAEEISLSYDTEPIRSEEILKTDEGEMHFFLKDTHAVFYYYEGDDEYIELPEEIQGLPLTVIGGGIYSIELGGITNLRGLYIPDTVEIIAPHAFSFMEEQDITLPDSIRDIGNEAFFYCSFPLSELPGTLQHLGTRALGKGTSFEEGLRIPDSLTDIEPGAFCDVFTKEFILSQENTAFSVREGSLYSADGTVLIAACLPDADGHFSVPEGTVRIGDYALSSQPLTSVEFPETLTEIGPYAFQFCLSLENIEIPETVSVIGESAFSMSGLREITVPATVESLGSNAFYATSLTSATIAAKKIPNEAFSYCRMLSEVTLEEGVEEIGDYAFYETEIAEVSLPDSLYVLGTEAFGSQDTSINVGVIYVLDLGSRLREFGDMALGALSAGEYVVSDENGSFKNDGYMLLDRAGKALISCPSAMMGEVIVPDGVYEIRDYAFWYCEYITDIYIPGSVQVIGAKAFNEYRYDYQERNKIIFHVEANSPAHRFAMENGWPYVVDDAKG